MAAQKTKIAALQQRLKEQNDHITALEETVKIDAAAQQQDRATMLGLRKEILVLKEYENKYVVLKDEKDIMEEFYHEHNNDNNQQLQTLNASLVECKQQRLQTTAPANWWRTTTHSDGYPLCRHFIITFERRAISLAVLRYFWMGDG